MKFLGGLFIFLFSLNCLGAESEKCVELCKTGSPSCISLGQEMKSSTQPLIDFAMSAQFKNEGVVGTICNRDTVLIGDAISNSGVACSFSHKISENSNTITDVPSFIQGLRQKTASGVYEVIFNLPNTFKSATYNKDGLMVLGGELASIVPFFDSNGAVSVVWETTNGWCYSQVDKL